MDRDRSRGRSEVSLFTLVLAVLAVVALGAVAATLALGVGAVSDDGPDTSFDFEYDGNVNPATTDSFGNTGYNHDGVLRVRLASGEIPEARDLVIVGASAEPVRATVSPGAGFAPESPVEADTTVTIWVDRDDTVTVRWQPPESATDISLARWS